MCILIIKIYLYIVILSESVKIIVPLQKLLLLLLLLLRCASACLMRETMTAAEAEVVCPNHSFVFVLCDRSNANLDNISVIQILFISFLTTSVYFYTFLST